MKLIKYLLGAGSFKWYYRLLNDLYRTVYGRELMLHFPFYIQENESFVQRQINLVNHCLENLGDLSDKLLLEVGCGNGANCKYISTLNETVNIIGIDLNEENLEIARAHMGSSRTIFLQDDAQRLEHIEDSSIDILICIESALHYPDKNAFFNQIKRVLKPDGRFVVADILRRTGDRGRSLWWWKKTMLLHHTHENDYRNYAAGNKLNYLSSRDISPEIMKGYEGHRSWIPKENRSWAMFILLRATLAILVRLYLKELRNHKKYMVFNGVHA
ncbi:MAG: class I SAM-dependent methyltransferase [Bacteroidales bacterium]|nr:class I SAM-dependent methyltransferase [Bacteroidales bacterium]